MSLSTTTIGGITYPLYTYDNIDYILMSDNTAAVVRNYYGYTGGYTVVNILSTFTTNGNTYKVTTLKFNGTQGAFTDKINITSVNIPNTVTRIEENAFKNTRMISISIPDSVTYIGYGAFNDNLNSLKYLKLPMGLTEIAGALLSGSGSLKYIDIPKGVKSIGAYAFASCGIYYINIPNGLTTIERNTFFACGLYQITIPDSVTRIEQEAFKSCSNLTSIVLPPNITYIGVDAFRECTNLTSIYFKGNIPYIDGSAFNGANKIAYYTANATNLNNLTSRFSSNSIFTTITTISNFNIPSSKKFYETLSITNPTSNSSGAFSYYSMDTSKATVNGSNITFVDQGTAPILAVQAGNATNTSAEILGIINVTCFKEGTKILTDKGYLPIESLRKGDLIQTVLHGFVPIDMIGKSNMHHPALQERIKDQLYKCTSEQYPEITEDLIITGCHSILVDDFISEEQKEKAIEINAGRLCVTDNKFRLPSCIDERASVYEIQGEYNIYHLALENDDYFMNYGIYANGLLVETCSKRYLKELSGMELL